MRVLEGSERPEAGCLDEYEGRCFVLGHSDSTKWESKGE